MCAARCGPTVHGTGSKPAGTLNDPPFQVCPPSKLTFHWHLPASQSAWTSTMWRPSLGSTAKPTESLPRPGVSSAPKRQFESTAIRAWAPAAPMSSATTIAATSPAVRVSIRRCTFRRGRGPRGARARRAPDDRSGETRAAAVADHHADAGGHERRGEQAAEQAGVGGEPAATGTTVRVRGRPCGAGVAARLRLADPQRRAPGRAGARGAVGRRLHCHDDVGARLDVRHLEGRGDLTVDVRAAGPQDRPGAAVEAQLD